MILCAFAATWGFSEALLFFVVPDVLITWVALKRGWRAGWQTALWALIGAWVGGALLLIWQGFAPQQAALAVEAVPFISPALMAQARENLNANGGIAILLGSLSGIPYKAFVIAAPAAGLGDWALLAWTLPGRGVRFFLAAAVASLAGRWLKARAPSRLAEALWLGSWLLIYASYWHAMEN